MTTIELNVRGATATAKVTGQITEGAVGIPVTVTVDSAWEGIAPKLVAACGGVEKTMLVSGTGKATLPWECLKAGQELKIGIDGASADGSIRIPTIWASCGRVQASTAKASEAGQGSRPTGTLVDQFYRDLRKAQEDAWDMEGKLDTIREDVDALNKGGLNLKEDFIGSQVNGWLDRHPEATTTVQNKSIGVQKLTEDAKGILTAGILNVASMVDGVLLNSNMAEAILAALEVSSRIYIPAGRWDFHVTITKDCDIYMDRDCVIATSTVDPAMSFIEAAVMLHGGTIEVGDPDFSTRAKRKYVNDTTSYGKGENGAVFKFTNCHNCGAEGIRSNYSKIGSILRFENCENVMLYNLDFSYMLTSGIHIYNRCVNVHMWNSRFRHMYAADYQYTGEGVNVPKTYCYGIYTGQRLFDPANPKNPTDGYCVENCYFEDSEDCALDTHGATNVTFRGNYFLNCRTSMTAYNDCRRASREPGWRMRNILVENNICISDRPCFEYSPSSTYAEGRSYWPHAFIFLGMSKPDDQDAENYKLGKGFDGYSDCIVRNNYFKSPNDYRYDGTKRGTLYFASGGVNVTIENNTFDGCDAATTAIRPLHMFNLMIRNNRFRGYTDAPIRFEHSLAEVANNVREGSLVVYSYSEKSYSYFAIQPSDNGMIFKKNKGLMCRCLDTLIDNSNHVSLNTQYGISVLPDAMTDYRTFTGTVLDGVVTVDDNIYIPYQRIRSSAGNYYVGEALDWKHFTLINSTSAKHPNGTFEFTCAEAVIVPIT